jgi:adenosylcobinamide kinase/adenosylcobinamide-phosphate guanylyltransferase
LSRLIFVTGGARSGKSDFSARLAEAADGKKVYIATATPGDPEMAERIARHKAGRGDGWLTVEEPVNLTEAVSGIEPGAALVLDCVTLWLTNLLMTCEDGFEECACARGRELVAALKDISGTAVVVSNEIGLGVVPDNALGRKFRDAAGRVNRIIAEAADEAYLVVSGMPVKIK